MTALLAAALLAASAPQAPPVFRAEVDVVRVEVLVTRGGVPVRGLGAADFEVRDNGGLRPSSRSWRRRRRSTRSWSST